MKKDITAMTAKNAYIRPETAPVRLTLSTPLADGEKTITASGEFGDGVELDAKAMDDFEEELDDDIGWPSSRSLWET